MRTGKITLSAGKAIPYAMRAANAWERMRGLLGRPELQANEALWIDPCPSVHTIGMGYAIDVIFLDKTCRVKKVVAGLKPFRFAACSGARSTLELAAGRAEQLGIEPGMVLSWQEGV